MFAYLLDQIDRLINEQSSDLFTDFNSNIADKMSEILNDEFEVAIDIWNCKLVDSESDHNTISIISVDDTKSTN